MTTMICGATGTIGSQLARELLVRGERVRAVSRRPAALSSLAEAGADVARVDLEEPSSLPAALEGVSKLFLVGPDVPEFGLRIKPVMAALEGSGVRFVLRYSAFGASSSAPFVLARQHGIAEEHVEAAGIPWAVLQPTFYQDNLINFAGEGIRVRGEFYGASGPGRTSYVSSADIVAVAATLLQRPEEHHGRRYVLTGGEALSDAELAELVSAVLDRPIRYVDLSPEELAAGMRARGMPGWIVDSLVALEGIKRAGLASAVSPAVSEITGREPETYRAFLARNRERLI